MGPVQTESQLAIFNRVSRIAASTVGAPISFITLRRDRQLSVLGSHGIYLRDFDESWSAASALVRRETMTYVKDVRRELQLRDHPLLKAAPFVRSMAHIPASGYNSEFEAAITILDPAAKWPFPATMSAILTDLAMLVGDGLSAGVGKATNNTNNDSIGSGLNENGDPIKVQPPINDYNTAAKFLISTLQERSSIRSRKDISFLTLRTWSKAIKAFQIEALRIVKLNPDPEFVKLVAEEFAQQRRRLHGTPSIGCVVPVPCGHSRRDDCLSVQIARSLAEVLGVPFVQALANDPKPGSSHPSKSATLKPPKLLLRNPLDTVLLVDDVVTSGRHIELSIKKLRETCENVSAIAWIGAN